MSEYGFYDSYDRLYAESYPPVLPPPRADAPRVSEWALFVETEACRPEPNFRPLAQGGFPVTIPAGSVQRLGLSWPAVRAQIDSVEPSKPDSHQAGILVFGNGRVEINPEARRLAVDGIQRHVGPTIFNTIEHLGNNVEHPVTTSALAAAGELSDTPFYSTRAMRQIVKMRVNLIRTQLGVDDLGKPDGCIQRVGSIGYVAKRTF